MPGSSKHLNLYPSTSSCRAVNSPAALLELYRNTCYDIRMSGGKRARLRIGEPVPSALINWANDTWPLFVVSACNPQSREFPAKENRLRMRMLRNRLASLPARLLPGVGHIPGQDWREPSLLVAGLNVENADSLAFKFNQNAIVIARNNHSVSLRIYCPKQATSLNTISGIETCTCPD